MSTFARRILSACLLIAVAAVPAVTPAQDDDLEWPFPEFTKQRSLKIKAELDNAYIKAVPQDARNYGVAVIPLESVEGTLADIEAAATLAEGEKDPRRLHTVRTTENRLYMTRGTRGAAWVPFSHDVRMFSAEVVVELDEDDSRLVVFYKLDMRLEPPLPSDWKILLGEASRWALAAEGK